MTESLFKGTKEDGDDQLFHPGQSLQYEREKQGLSVKEIAQQLRLSIAVINHLEDGSFDLLPELVYVRGYIRAYCKLLKIDSEPLLGNSMLMPSRQIEEGFPPAMNDTFHRVTRLWGSFVILSVIILLVAFWWIEQPRQFKELAQTVPVTTQEPILQKEGELFTRQTSIDNEQTEPAFGSSAVATGQTKDVSIADDNVAEITINSANHSWVHVTDNSGEVLINQVLFPGYRETIRHMLPLDFKIGDARKVRIWVNGTEYDVKKHISRLNTAFFSIEISDQ